MGQGGRYGHGEAFARRRARPAQKGLTFRRGFVYSSCLWRVATVTKIDYERLRKFDRSNLQELDEMIKRNIRREAENKARELAEKLAKKKRKKKRLMRSNNN